MKCSGFVPAVTNEHSLTLWFIRFSGDTESDFVLRPMSALDWAVMRKLKQNCGTLPRVYMAPRVCMACSASS